MQKITSHIAITLLLVCVPLLAKATLPDPRCSALDSWVSSEDKNEKFEVHPDVKINALFKDDNLLPLFNKPITGWEKQDYGTLMNQLAKCRKEAGKGSPLAKNYTAVMLTIRTYSRGRGLTYIQKGKPEGQQTARTGSQSGKQNAPSGGAFDLAPYLSALLKGDEVEDITIRGLRPGMKMNRVVNELKKEWGYAPDGRSMEPNTFTIPRSQRARYKVEQRSGGQVKLTPMDNGKAGQIRFEEHFLGMSVPAQGQRHLTEQLGKPDRVQHGGGGTFMSWKDGDYRLQVFVTNQLDVFWAGAGYKSRVLLSLWNEDFEDHLQEINERCEEIKSKSRRDLSMKDSTFMMSECNLGSKGRKPGL